MWNQPIDPCNNILLSALCASAPLVLLAVLLLSRKVSGTTASISALILALFIALFAYGMPVQLVGLSALYGMATGLLPIGWIVINAVFLYNLSVESGSFAVVRDSIEIITKDRRLQALLIAFCFGAFLEGAAGFGAPVAITAGMLVGLGFDALYAASICLLANTAPVAFGAIGIAVITAGHVAGIDPNLVSRMIGHQLPFVAAIIPLWLVVLVAGWRGAREVWPAITVTGLAYAITMFLTASYLGPTLPDIFSSIVSLVSLILLLRVWHPATVWRFPHEQQNTEVHEIKTYTTREIIHAWTPYLLLVIFITNWALPGQQSILGKTSLILPFGALAHAIVVAGQTLSVNYSFAYLSATGTAILFAALLTILFQRIPLTIALRVARDTAQELARPLITIASVVGFAYVANYSGMSATLAAILSRSGAFFPFLAPILGWLGVFLTGSDTSSNALFSGVQAHTAQAIGIDPVLTVAANSSGGVAAKMISPQSIAVAAASTKLVGHEGELFRRTVIHSIGIVLIIALITFLQAYVFTWMIPSSSIATATLTARFGLGSLAIVIVSCVIVIALLFVGQESSRAR